MMRESFGLALVLGGGNALGSYQAGAYAALHERGFEPDWIVGTSAGAINGALIAGNAPDDRVARLTDFWRPAGSPAAAAPWWSPHGETLRRTGSVLSTMVLGRAGLFDAVGPLGSWWRPDPRAAGPGLFDLSPLVATLTRLVDFERLNDGDVRYTAGAVDLDSGADVFFDTTKMRIIPDHVRASAALLPTFPPVEIDGRAYVDGGLSANLPLDPVLAAPFDRTTLCIALDLLPIAERRPSTLGEAIARAQDLIFAAQSRRTIERWRADYVARDARDAVTLVHLTYADQEPEVAGKGMDFSPESVAHRWQAGRRDAMAVLDRIARGEIVVGRSGLSVFGRMHAPAPA